MTRALVGRRVYLTSVVSLLGPVTAAAQKLVTAPGPGTPSTVRVIDASGADQSFLVHDPAFLGSVRVALGDVNGDGVSDIDRDGVNEIVTGPLTGTPLVRIWARRGRGARFALAHEYLSFDRGAGPGGTVVASDTDNDSDGNLRFVSAAETAFAVGSPGTFTVRTKGGPKPALTQSECAALRGDLHRQRERHGDARGHAWRGNGRHLSADDHRHEQRIFSEGNGLPGYQSGAACVTP